MALQAENLALRRSSQHGNPDSGANLFDRIDPEMTEALATEKKMRREIEKELKIQVRNSEGNLSIAFDQKTFPHCRCR